jgi:poly(3-hydroxybutyrate) depolymerase
VAEAPPVVGCRNPTTRTTDQDWDPPRDFWNGAVPKWIIADTDRNGDGDAADKHAEFYDEYLSVLDLTEEFYLQTIDIVFQQHLLPRGLLEHRGRRVDPAAITDIGLMTVEGEKDDISGVGQTQAAHGLCTAIPDDRRVLYVNPDVGHYGVFNGRRFRDDIYPRIRDFISANEAAHAVSRRPAAAA